jgi:hypothetical protein
VEWKLLSDGIEIHEPRYAYLLFEAVLEEQRHGSIQMLLHPRQIVALVGVDLLLEQCTAHREGFRKHHALHKMNIIVSSSVNLHSTREKKIAVSQSDLR